MAQTPNTKEWKAWENRMPGTGEPTLLVTGEVETSNSNQTPVLSEANPQGIVESILILNLSIASSGAGGTVMGWKPAKFSKTIKAGQYRTVDIHANGGSIATCRVVITQ